MLSISFHMLLWYEQRSVDDTLSFQNVCGARKAHKATGCNSRVPSVTLEALPRASPRTTHHSPYTISSAPFPMPPSPSFQLCMSKDRRRGCEREHVVFQHHHRHLPKCDGKFLAVRGGGPGRVDVHALRSNGGDAFCGGARSDLFLTGTLANDIDAVAVCLMQGRVPSQHLADTSTHLKPCTIKPSDPTFVHVPPDYDERANIKRAQLLEKEALKFRR